MTQRLDDAITALQDYCINEPGNETAEGLAPKIQEVVDAARIPFEIEILDTTKGLLVRVPVEFNHQEMGKIQKQMEERFGRGDLTILVCHNTLDIEEFNDGLVRAARLAIQFCIPCKGTGVVDDKNCGVCADLRAALSFTDTP